MLPSLKTIKHKNLKKNKTKKHFDPLCSLKASAKNAPENDITALVVCCIYLLSVLTNVSIGPRSDHSPLEAYTV